MSDSTVIHVEIASEKHKGYIPEILTTIEESAKVRGTGISKRSQEYIEEKIDQRKAIIALTKDLEFVGFCYIESWSNKLFVANSGLIVTPKYRHLGVAKLIKEKAFQHSRALFPQAKIFGLTTSHAVMKINSHLGYKPVVFSELTNDEAFWKGCQSCVNYDILLRTNKKNCLCTSMLYDPNDPQKDK